TRSASGRRPTSPACARSSPRPTRPSSRRARPTFASGSTICGRSSRARRPALDSQDLAPVVPPPLKHKRYLRNYIIDKRLQLRYIAVVPLASAAICTPLGYMIWAQRAQASQTIRRSLAQAADFIGPSQQAEILAHLAGSDTTVLVRMALVCGALILVLSGVLVVMTHKAAGPLYVIGGYFDKLFAGKLPLVHNLRRGDEFKTFHKKF